MSWRRSEARFFDMSVVQCHKAIFFLMRIIAVWSLFARLPVGTTGEKGMFGSCRKKYYRPPGAVEIFSGKCHRISRPGVFINSERTDFEPRLLSAINIELATPRWVTLNGRHTRNAIRKIIAMSINMPEANVCHTLSPMIMSILSLETAMTAPV